MKNVIQKSTIKLRPITAAADRPMFLCPIQPDKGNQVGTNLMTTHKTLFLFDVDGVLIHPRGYKEALRAALDYFATQMGQPPIDLTYDEIADFEAAGITNEWDSLPMCISAMLIDALSQHPNLPRSGFAAMVAAIRDKGIQIQRLDFSGLAYEVMENNPDGEAPTVVIRRTMKAKTDESVHPIIDELLGDVYDLRTPTTRVFQHYTLGSQQFTETYSLPADFTMESALSTYDRPLLGEERKRQLLDGLQQGHWGAVVYTARPSLPPADLPPDRQDEFDPHKHPPEGDLAAELLGLDGIMPMIAGGRVTWLAIQNNKHVEAYIKPSPVQALAAIGAAYSGYETAALEQAAAFFEQGELTGAFVSMSDQPIRVVVFEDSTGGIRATKLAVEKLRDAGLDVVCEAVGVSPEQNKKDALKQVADRVVDDVNQGLEPYLIPHS
jgi:hypothetical protein